jgi:hypothetical protein
VLLAEYRRTGNIELIGEMFNWMESSRHVNLPLLCWSDAYTLETRRIY